MLFGRLAPVIVEWVYRTKYGYKDERRRIFKKYQLAILAREKHERLES